MYGRMGSTATVQRQAARRSMVGWRATAACHRLAADYGGVAGPRGGVLLLGCCWCSCGLLVTRVAAPYMVIFTWT